MIEEVHDRPAKDTHTLLRTFAERWLKICGFENPNIFEAWVKEERVRTFVAPQGILLVNELMPTVRATLHPIFWVKRPLALKTEFKHCLKELFKALNVERLQVSVSETAGKSLRRLLRDLGFTHEGTLRSAFLDRLSPERRLISLEIWSILRMEILEESDER